MIDQPDRPDGDRLLRGLIFKVLSEEITQPRPEYLPAHFNNAITRLLALVNEQTRVPTRDGAEGAEPRYFIEDNCIIDGPKRQKLARFEIWDGCLQDMQAILDTANVARAPPKPAPDAMRTWTREEQMPKFDYCCHGIERRDCEQCSRALSAPVPPADALRQNADRAHDKLYGFTPPAVAAEPAIDKTKLYTVLSKSIPADMIDGIWQELNQ